MGQRVETRRISRRTTQAAWRLLSRRPLLLQLADQGADRRAAVDADAAAQPAGDTAAAEETPLTDPARMTANETQDPM